MKAHIKRYNIINRLKSLKDKVQLKQEWSEEDEKMLSDIEYCIKNLPIFYESLNINGEDKTTEWFVCDAINWLKFLKERYIWKPNEEQIEALDSATENCAYSEYQDCLRELIGQLKKLREE